MRKLWLSLACVFAVASAPAQEFYPVGVHDVAWTNTTGFGTPTLSAQVHYPAQTSGVDALPLQRAGGWPVAVFLHGYSLLGSDYADFGHALAEAGYVAILLDTAQFNPIELEHDARAVYKALPRANVAIGTLLRGMFDLNRTVLMGHSMGGYAAAFVLVEATGHQFNNPGYVAGLAFAPVDPGPAAAALIRVPFGIVVGEADLVTPPAQHAEVFYNDVGTETGIKFLYTMGTSCNHMNVVGLDPAFPQVFGRTKAIALGFFGQFLETDMRGLDSVLGPAGVESPLLSSLDHEVLTPQVWTELKLQLGVTSRVSLTAENGLCGLIGATDLAPFPLQTIIGELLVDPVSAFPMAETVLTTQRLDVMITVPSQESLVGMTFALQGVGPTAGEPFLLGSAVRLQVGP